MTPHVLWLNKHSAKPCLFVCTGIQNLGSKSGSSSWGVLFPRQAGCSADRPFHSLGSLKVPHLTSENEAREAVKCQVRTRGKCFDMGGRAVHHGVPLINDHDPSLLPSIIQRVDPGRPQWQFETKSVDGTIKPHQAHCDLCFPLTGVKKFLGGDKEYMAYHMEAK